MPHLTMKAQLLSRMAPIESCPLEPAALPLPETSG